MRNLIFSTAVTSLVASTNLSAGLVTFDPHNALVNAIPGGSISLDVRVSAESLDSWDAVSVLFGSDTLLLPSFTWNPDLTPMFTPSQVMDNSVYTNGLLVGMFLQEAVDDVVIGSLEVQWEDGTFGRERILVSSQLDFDLSNIALGIQQEALNGHTEMHFIPEPATLAMLSIGLFALRRRRTHA